MPFLLQYELNPFLPSHLLSLPLRSSTLSVLLRKWDFTLSPQSRQRHHCVHRHRLPGRTRLDQRHLAPGQRSICPRGLVRGRGHEEEPGPDQGEELDGRRHLPPDREFASNIVLGNRKKFMGESLSTFRMKAPARTILASEANNGYFTPYQARSHMDAESGDCLGWAARDASGVLSPYRFSRRGIGNCDISLKITHCGVCYADVAETRNEHGNSNYPLVPGHEIVGVVMGIGSNVDCFKVGDHVGVGTCVNSCKECEYCNERLEVHCLKVPTLTFNALDSDGTFTKGGYSSYIVVHERYCYVIPDGYPLAQAAPLLCAGITVYTPMIRHKMNQPGKSLGVIGLGGLGHMAVKFGRAFGLKVTILSTSASKEEEALKILGADKFVITSDEKEMQSLAHSLDFIIDTASGDHPFDPYMSLLKVGGIMVLVGFPSEIKMHPASLNIGSKTLSGSVAGGTKDTQEMLDYCAANKIYPNVEVIPIQYINEALERLINRDVKYRFVIDIENSLK